VRLLRAVAASANSPLLLTSPRILEKRLPLLPRLEDRAKTGFFSVFFYFFFFFASDACLLEKVSCPARIFRLARK